MQTNFNLYEAILNFLQSLDSEVSEAAFSYAAAMVLLVVLIALSRWQKIGIEEKLIIGTVRGTIQIILMALILLEIFALQNLFIIFTVLAFMALFAAHTSQSNLDDIPGIFKAGAPAILLSGLSVMVISVLLGVVRPVGEYIIPMGGMVIGNAMGINSLVMERMWSNAQKQRSLLETALALGASPLQATNMTIRESIRSGLLPNLNRYASLGIVSIPGLMSGMIIGGTPVLAAALYQVIVFVMIFLACIMSGLIASRIFLKEMFNKRAQITVPPPES